VSRLVDWLSNREGHSRVEPIQICIDDCPPQKFEGAEYIYSMNGRAVRQIYLLGSRPASYVKNSEICFLAKRQHKSLTEGWYVQGYFDNTCDLCKNAEVVHEQYRPFGCYFVLAIWEPRFGISSHMITMSVSPVT
jgi:hypothetical protein